jgi:hypothetical protein
MGLTLGSVWKQTPAQLSIEFLSHLLAFYPKCNFQVRLWDGNTWGTERAFYPSPQTSWLPYARCFCPRAN